MSEGHSSRGGSGAHRWAVCPASVSMGLRHGSPAGESAAKGTVKHMIREYCLRFGESPESYVGSTFECDGYKFTVDQSWVGHIDTPMFRAIRELPTRGYIEQRVDISPWAGLGQFSSIDFAAILPDHLLIDDYKSGEGIMVFPEENPQLVIYALGFWHTIARHITDVKKVVIHVDQPTIAGAGGFWETDIDTLLEMGEEFKKASALSEFRPDLYKPSPQSCQWCAGRLAYNRCPAYQQSMLDSLGLTDENLADLVEDAESDGYVQINSLPDPALSERGRSSLLKNAAFIRKWLATLEDEAKKDIIDGKEVIGMKVVQGRSGARQWTVDDELEMEKIIKEVLAVDDVRNHELMTPVQLERKVSSKKLQALADYIVSKEGNPQLVSVDDKRPSYNPVERMFECYDD